MFSHLANSLLGVGSIPSGHAVRAPLKMKLWLRPGLWGDLSAVEKQTERGAATSEGVFSAGSQEELEPAAAAPRAYPWTPRPALPPPGQGSQPL